MQNVCQVLVAIWSTVNDCISYQKLGVLLKVIAFCLIACYIEIFLSSNTRLSDTSFSSPPQQRAPVVAGGHGFGG